MLIVFLVKFYWPMKCQRVGNTASDSMPGLLENRDIAGRLAGSAGRTRSS